MPKLALSFLRLLPVFLVALALLVPSAVAADRGLTVEGAILFREVSPGQTVTHSMTVSIGAGHAATEITVRAAHFSHSLTGTYQLLETAGNAALTAFPFITLDKESFYLEPGGSEVVTATIQVPQDVGAGSRYALINIRTGATGDGAVGTISAVNVPIGLTVKDTLLHRQGEIIALTLEPAGGQALDIAIIFRNTGNHHYRIKGEIVISRFRGQTLTTIAVPRISGSTVPDNERQLKAKYSPEEALAEGVYIVKFSVMLEDDTVVDEKRAAFEVTQTGIVILPEAPEEDAAVDWLMFGVIVGGAVAVGLVIILVRRRRSAQL